MQLRSLKCSGGFQHLLKCTLDKSQTKQPKPETLRRVAVILAILVDLGSLGVAQVVEERFVDQRLVLRL